MRDACIANKVTGMICYVRINYPDYCYNEIIPILIIIAYYFKNVFIEIDKNLLKKWLIFV